MVQTEVPVAAQVHLRCLGPRRVFYTWIRILRHPLQSRLGQDEVGRMAVCTHVLVRRVNNLRAAFQGNL